MTGVLHKYSAQAYAMYYINDHLNSPAALVSGSTGAVVQRYEYEAKFHLTLLPPPVMIEGLIMPIRKRKKHETKNNNP